MSAVHPIGLISAIAEETAILRDRLAVGAAETHAAAFAQSAAVGAAAVVTRLLPILAR